MFGPTVFRVPKPKIPKCTAGATAGRTLTWEVFPWQSEREVLGGLVLDATMIENEKLKKGLWLCDTTKCVIFGSSVTWVLFFFFFILLTPCAFTCAVSEDTCWYTPMCKRSVAVLLKNVHVGFSEKSHRTPAGEKVQFCRNVCLVCVSVPLCCPAVLHIDSSWPTQAAHHTSCEWRRDVSLLVVGGDLGGIKRVFIGALLLSDEEYSSRTLSEYVWWWYV